MKQVFFRIAVAGLVLVGVTGGGGIAAGGPANQFTNRQFLQLCQSNMDNCKHNIDVAFNHFAFIGGGGCPPETLTDDAMISAVIGWWTSHPDQYATQYAKPGETAFDRFDNGVDTAANALWPCSH